MLPRAGEGHVPFKRLLSWFAWLAKVVTLLPAPIHAALDESLTATASEEATAPLKALLEDAVNSRLVSRLVSAMAL